MVVPRGRADSHTLLGHHQLHIDYRWKQKVRYDKSSKYRFPNTHKYRNKYRCKYRHKNRSKRMIFWKSFKRSWPQRKPFSSIFCDSFLAFPSLINCCQVQSFAAQMRGGWHGTRLAEQSEHSTLARNRETQCNGGGSVICARYRCTEDTVCREGIQLQCNG